MRPQSLPIIAALVLLLFLRPGVGEDAPVAVSVPGSVTATVLEAKVAEVEAAAELEDDAKADFLSLYRQALTNLQAATSSEEAAQAFEQARQTAPSETQSIRQKMDGSQAVAPEKTLEANPSTPLHEIDLLLQKEKADLAAVDARRAVFAKRLEEEAGRPALIRQRLTEAKDHETQKLCPRITVLVTRFTAKSVSIALDHSQSHRMAPNDNLAVVAEARLLSR